MCDILNCGLFWESISHPPSNRGRPFSVSSWLTPKSPLPFFPVRPTWLSFPPPSADSCMRKWESCKGRSPAARLFHGGLGWGGHVDTPFLVELFPDRWVIC